MSLLETLDRGRRGQVLVDDWGADRSLMAAVAPVARLAWRVEVLGADHLPAEGPVLIVGSRSPLGDEPLAAALGLGRLRPMHVAAGRDLPVVGPLGRRLGFVIGADVAGIVRHGGAVVSFVGRRGRTVEPIPTAWLERAVASGATVLPMWVEGRIGPRRTVRLGEAIERPDADGPLAVIEMADQLRAVLAGSGR